VPSNIVQELAIAPRQNSEIEKERLDKLKKLFREQAEKAIESYRERVRNVGRSRHLRKAALLKVAGVEDQAHGRRKASNALPDDGERAKK